MHLIWLSIDATRQHRKYPDNFYVAAHEINKVFGRKPLFSAFNNIHEIFHTTPPINSTNPEDSYTTAYKLNPYTSGKAFQSFLEEDAINQTNLITIDGKKIKTPPSAILSRTKRTDTRKPCNTKWRHHTLESATPINIEALTAFKNNLRDLKKHVTQTVAREKLDGIFNVAAKTLILARNTVKDNHLFTQYEQAVSGRLYATGFSLQTAYRLVRQAALAGQWDYDISNAHYSILNQLAARVGYACTAIPHYLENKRQVREDLASSTGISVEDIKTILISLIYGAKSDNRLFGAVAEVVNDPVRTQLLQSQPAYRELAHETKRAFEAILAAQPTDRIINAMGSSESRSKEEPSLVSHLLQGVEAQALRAVVDRYGPSITLCVHDGWCSSERLDVNELERVIQSATGMTLRVEEKQMKTPSADDVLAAIQPH